ncbi:MAG: hypothetical protein C5B52_12195 [Bacteroidetes bacterium]|nr:MAG: hypothetical protein C5B52_12195 [Bacteroidota bacterium]
MNSKILNVGRKVFAGALLLAFMIVLVKKVTAESKCNPINTQAIPAKNMQQSKGELGYADRDQPWTMAGLLVI